MNIQLRRKDSTIYIMFYRHSQRVIFTTELKCEDKQWNAKSNKLKLNTPADYNLQDKIDKQVTDVRAVVLNNPKVSNTKLKDLIKADTEETNEVWAAVAIFLEHINATGTPGRHTRYKDITAKLRLIDPELMWSTVNMQLYDKIVAWYHEKDYSINYMGRQIKYMKTFFNWAANRGYLNDYSFKNFKSFSQETEVLYLSEDELQLIATADLKSDRLDRIRDLFVFMCYTGLRHSDAVSTRPAHFNGDMLIKTTVKTSDPDLVIPLVGHALRIAKKYEYDLPRISSQKMNINLSTIGELAEVNKPTATVVFKASGSTETVHPKYMLITSKMARKTFVTLSLQKGMPAEVIMSITGHKKHEVMRKYLKVTNTFKFDEMKKWT